jgi:hypothetical protein
VPRSGVKKGFDCEANEVNTDKPRQSCSRSRARLLIRGFKVDVLECPCGGQLKPAAVLSDFSSSGRYLEKMGYEADPPPIQPTHESSSLVNDREQTSR